MDLKKGLQQFLLGKGNHVGPAAGIKDEFFS